MKIEDEEQNSLIVIASYIAPSIQSIANSRRSQLLEEIKQIQLEYNTEEIVLAGDLNIPMKQINKWVGAVTELLKADKPPQIATRGQALLDFIIVPRSLKKGFEVRESLWNSDHRTLIATLVLRTKIRRKRTVV